MNESAPAPVVYESAPAPLVIVTDDVAASETQPSPPWPPVRIVRSEQLLFGAADNATVLVRDAATVSSSALVSLPGVAIHQAHDLTQACEIAVSVLAKQRAPHAIDHPASAQPDPAAVTRSGAHVPAQTQMPRATAEPAPSQRGTLPPRPAPEADLPAAETAEHRRSSSPVVVILNAVGGAGASTLAWAAASFYESTRGSAAIVDGDDRSPGLDISTCDEATPAVRWPDLAAVTGAVDPRRLWQCLIHVTPGIRLLSQGRMPVSPSAATAAAVMDALAGRPVVADFSSTRASAAMTEVLSRADAVVVVSTATVAGCTAARTRIDSVRGDIRPGVQVLAALRERHPGVSLNAAREALGIEVLALPEDPRTTRLLRERSLRGFLSQRWTPLGRALDNCTSAAAAGLPPASTMRRLLGTTGGGLRVVRGDQR